MNEVKCHFSVLKERQFHDFLNKLNLKNALCNNVELKV